MAANLTTRPQGTRSSMWPWGSLGTLRDDIDDLMGRLIPGEESGLTWMTHVPSIDVSETENEICVKVDLPGMKSEEIDISLDANMLTISGERTDSKDEKGRTFHRVERRAGKFSRTVSLPCNVMEDEVAADYRDGTLTVTLPKCENAKKRKIQVKS